MREIKFRAWDKKRKELVHPSVSDVMIDAEGFIYYIGDFKPEFQERFILQQFTGLKDKNGKEIFEGDIVKWYNGKEEVSFEDGRFVVSFMDLNDMVNQMKCKVIGNKFENPELLNHNQSQD